MFGGHILRRERIQSAHFAVERPIREEAEHAGNLDRVVEAALFDVGLTDQRDFAICPVSKRPSIAASAGSW